MSNEEKLSVFINKFWNPVQETLDALTTKSPAEISEWFVPEKYVSAYTQVYMCCVAPVIIPPPSEPDARPEFFHGKLIYERLRDYMTKRFQDISVNIASQSDPYSSFNTYIAQHQAFETYRKFIEKTFHYIQRHWIELVNKTSSRAKHSVLPIEKILVSLWIDQILSPNLPRILEGARNELSLSRQAHTQDIKLPLLIDFVSLYSQAQELPNASTVCDKISSFYGDNLKAYSQEVITHLGALDSAKSEAIILIWNEEMERIKASFGKVKDLVKNYKKILRENLLEAYSQAIVTILSDSLKSSKINIELIRGYYKIYSSYNVLHPRLKKIFAQVFEEKVNAGSDNLISHLLECTIWAETLLRECFEEDSDFLSARDEVLRSVFSGSTGSVSTLMLAARIDEVIRSMQAFAEDSCESRQLLGLMTLFRFVDDKETFRVNYSHFLALRLLNWRKQDTETLTMGVALERRIIGFIENTCGSGFIGLQNRMIADIENENENSRGLLPLDVSSNVGAMLLTGGSWPQIKKDWGAKIWPESFQNILSATTANYLKNHTGRKVEWFPELSYVKVLLGNCSLTLSVFQFSFLTQLLQSGLRASKTECLNYYEVTEEVFYSLIYGLISCGLLLLADNNETLVFNEAAVQTLPPQLDLAYAVRNTTWQADQSINLYDSGRNLPVDYDTLIQSHLVRISKREGKNGKLLKEELFEKVKGALALKISVANPQLEAQLKILIEKEYVEMDIDGKFVKYCP